MYTIHKAFCGFVSVFLAYVMMLCIHAHLYVQVDSILLGPYKYLLRRLMSKLTPQKKEDIRARIIAFSYTGFKARLSTDIFKYTGSLVGRDLRC